jgi:hypothetical protein
MVDGLPKEVLRLIILEAKDPVLFRVSKLFASFSLDEEFWKSYVKESIDRNLSSFSGDFRFALLTNAPTSWKSYALLRLQYEKNKKEVHPHTAKRLLVRTTLIVSNSLQKELRDLQRDPPHYVSVGPIDENYLLHWMGTMLGPVRMI